MVHRDMRGETPGQSTLNLRMLFSTQCNGDINLCSMVRSISPRLRLLGDRTAAVLSGIAIREGPCARSFGPVTGCRSRGKSRLSGGANYLSQSAWSHSTLTVAAAAAISAVSKPACLTIAALFDHNLGIDMSKPRLQLVHSSNSIRPEAKGGRSFRPLVIPGGARTRSAPGESAWEAAFQLIDLGFLNYLAFLEASTAVLRAHNRTAPVHIEMRDGRS